MLELVTILGRAAMAFVFILVGMQKLSRFDKTAAFIGSRGMPFTKAQLAVAIAVEVLGGLSLLFGYHARVGALVLALYLVPVTLLFHAFWWAPQGEGETQKIMFTKNLAMFGGLLMVAVRGAGAGSRAP